MFASAAISYAVLGVADSLPNRTLPFFFSNLLPVLILDPVGCPTRKLFERRLKRRGLLHSVIPGALVRHRLHGAVLFSTNPECHVAPPFPGVFHFFSTSINT